MDQEPHGAQPEYATGRLHHATFRALWRRVRRHDAHTAPCFDCRIKPGDSTDRRTMACQTVPLLRRTLANGCNPRHAEGDWKTAGFQPGNDLAEVAVSRHLPTCRNDVCRRIRTDTKDVPFGLVGVLMVTNKYGDSGGFCPVWRCCLPRDTFTTKLVATQPATGSCCLSSMVWISQTSRLGQLADRHGIGDGLYLPFRPHMLLATCLTCLHQILKAQLAQILKDMSLGLLQSPRR